MVRKYIKRELGKVFEYVHYLRTDRLVKRELDSNGIPVDSVIVREGKS